MQIQTSAGMVDRELLEDRDKVTWEDDARVVTTEWHMDGKLVRRDRLVAPYAGPEAETAILDAELTQAELDAAAEQLQKEWADAAEQAALDHAAKAEQENT